MDLTVETYWQDNWHESAAINIAAPASGYVGQSIVDYDIGYFSDFAAVDGIKGPVIDARALSVNYPVDLASRHRPTWPPFLLDLMPQGHARRKLSEHLSFAVDAREADMPLLLRAGSNPIGNIRIKEAAEQERDRLAKVMRRGVTEDDIFDRTDLFVEVVDRFGMLASGSSGLQGEWPKVALTLAEDGLWYPDAFVDDEEARMHVIVKLLRSNEERDRLILEAEAGYSKLARELGLNVMEPSRYRNGVLMIPRFDRDVIGGRRVRHGQESLVSASGVAEFGHLADHERYINILKRFSDDPFADIVEYMKRDLANRALGNPDNHGRNGALSKGAQGGVRLSPLFDFAPMRLATDGVVPSTRWGVMRAAHRDNDPDWGAVCGTLFPDDAEKAAVLYEEMAEFAARLLHAPALAVEFGIPDPVIKMAMARCADVVKPLLRRPDIKFNPGV
ncbi:MAG TPA: HipA domain-containing protein [Ensifer sp.]|nr:HipA domain-containing protein [Ensifer sp.]